MFEPMINLGSFSVRTYTCLIALAIFVSLLRLLYHTPAGKRGAVMDVSLGGLSGGLLLARLVHVALQWRYFTYNIPEISNWTAGGLDWRGAVVGSILGMGLVSWWRNPTAALADFREGELLTDDHSGEDTMQRVPTVQTGIFSLAKMLDILTPMLPVFALAGWWGCGAALCAYGAEVQRMADYPPFMTWEAMDAFGIVAPRFQTQVMGMAAAVLLFGVALILLRLPRLAGRRFWIILMLLALTMFGLGFLRGDYALHIYGLRVDMVLDVIVALWAGVMVFRGRHN